MTDYEFAKDFGIRIPKKKWFEPSFIYKNRLERFKTQVREVHMKEIALKMLKKQASDLHTKCLSNGLDIPELKLPYHPRFLNASPKGAMNKIQQEIRETYRIIEELLKKY